MPIARLRARSMPVRSTARNAAQSSHAVRHATLLSTRFSCPMLRESDTRNAIFPQQREAEDGSSRSRGLLDPANAAPKVAAVRVDCSRHDVCCVVSGGSG